MSSPSTYDVQVELLAVDGLRWQDVIQIEVDTRHLLR